jgi:hypothetical protein
MAGLVSGRSARRLLTLSRSRSSEQVQPGCGSVEPVRSSVLKVLPTYSFSRSKKWKCYRQGLGPQSPSHMGSSTVACGGLKPEMSRANPCPFRNQSANEGGYRDESVEEHTEPVVQWTNTSMCGTRDPDAPCAFRALLQQMLAQQEIDRTQVCPQCERVVRIHSLKIKPLPDEA